MPVKNLNLLDEGSWALMIEETNVRALQKYHGSMAHLDIGYYLSVGANRYYKSYFDESGLTRVREAIVGFLLNEPLYTQCISEIHAVLERMRLSDEAFVNLDLLRQFELYCDILCDYCAYYNSVITDTFFAQVFDIVDSEFPDELRFAVKPVKDALFATNNNSLLTHTQTLDMLTLSQSYLAGREIDEAIEVFVEKYRSTTISSASPNGVTVSEVREHISQQTAKSVRLERAFLDNLEFRYSNSEVWSKKTASLIGLSDQAQILVRNTSALSHLKILMREEFQKFKVSTRNRFLHGLIAKIGKQQFDYMLIDEIADFIRSGKRVLPAELEKRQRLAVFELEGESVNLLDAIPDSVRIESDRHATWHELAGDVLIGAGAKRYRVKKVEQHEEGLNSFDQFLSKSGSKEQVAVITNVLRPYLVPKLRNVGALITQYGGYTSHASVLCRELGINSMISVDGLLDALETDDEIEVDFDMGTIRKISGIAVAEEGKRLIVDLDVAETYTSREIGAKAANLVRSSGASRVAKGFVVTSQALERIDEEEVREKLFEKLASLRCERIVIRSSHESEDGNLRSYAGLFESYVDVDAEDHGKVIALAKAVYASHRANPVDVYGRTEGDMAVIIQEMIPADISGVILTSQTFEGYDYLLVEYIVGNLSHLMQGDITPLMSFIKKVDVFAGRREPRAYPAIITDKFGEQIKELAETAVELERRFGQRVEIEWGVKGEEVYIFQVRPY